MLLATDKRKVKKVIQGDEENKCNWRGLRLIRGKEYHL
jgi:hypothetical protein